jgi:hypothetical protein
MKDKNSEVPKKHYFPIPKNFAKFNDGEIEEYASQLHGQILGALGESEMNPKYIAIKGSSFIGLIEGEERIATVAKFMNSRLVAGKLKCKTSWCAACKTKILSVGDNPLLHVLQISLPIILELQKVVNLDWEWAEPEGDWAKSHGKASDNFQELVDRKSRPNFVIRPVQRRKMKVLGSDGQEISRKNCYICHATNNLTAAGLLMVCDSCAKINPWVDTKSPDLMPAYAQVAELVADNFPDSELRIDAIGPKAEFTLFFNDELLLTVNDIGWTYTTGDRSGTWSSIIEGGIESISGSILQRFADRDFLVYHPSRTRGSNTGGQKRRITKSRKLIRPKKEKND